MEKKLVSVKREGEDGSFVHSVYFGDTLLKAVPALNITPEQETQLQEIVSAAAQGGQLACLESYNKWAKGEA